MPSALTFPIGSRFYDWQYESEPEPFMGGRRIYHARGKVLGGQQQHQRPDLPARQPARLRALGRRPGHGRPGTTPTACPTSSGWRRAWRPRPTTRGAATTVRSSWSAGRPPTRCSPPSSRPRSRPATRGPTTSTATARRASRRSTGTSTGADGCRPRGPTSTRSWRTRRTSRVRTSTLVTAAPPRRHARDRRGDRAARRRHRDDRRR